MLNSKYNKFLTVLLIAIIVVVVGLLGFLGYDVYRKYTIEADSDDAISRFEEAVKRQNRVPSDDVVYENTDVNGEGTISPDIDMNTLNSESSSGSSSGTKTVKYKGYDMIGTIEIPKTSIKYPIIKSNDVSINSLEIAICNLYGELNVKGSNAVLVGHNYKNGTFFSNNKKLNKGDEIYITDIYGNKVTYVIYKKYETSTGDFDYATRDVGDKREISLSTCTDDTKRRLIIWAAEKTN